MDKKRHAIAIEEFLLDYVAKRESFRPEGRKSVEHWHSKDKAALVCTRVNPQSDAPSYVVVFTCAHTLDPDAPPVTGWVRECLDAARAALPEDCAALGEPTPLIRREAGSGLEPI